MIHNKLTSLQISWVKTIDNCFHEYKIILIYLPKKMFGPTFKFHSSLSFNKSTLKKLLIHVGKNHIKITNIW